MRSLYHLLSEPRDPDAPVARRWDAALRSDRVVPWNEFRSQVESLRGEIAEHPDGPWVLLTQDAYAFAVGLLALWHSGRHAVSPPNRQPEALRLLQTRAVGVLSDRPDWFAEGCCIDPLAAPESGEATDLAALDPQAIALELFTSGTTGVEKPVAKRLRHLADEVHELHATWGHLLDGATVFATASHQHLYGLLFGLLLPLCAGRPFHANHFLHSGELLPRIRAVGPFTLASVPTHLKRLARHGEMATLRSQCRAVFSSGGPLATETAHAIAGVLGRAPLEVLGSTETGGVAWRAQEPGEREPPWAPFPSVRVASDPGTGVARVRSPFVSVNGADLGFAMGDRVALDPDGRFRMQGRADRVVKVGEKRLDLTQMESELRAHPWVAEVALTTLDGETETRVAAAVVPTPGGWEAIQRDGRRSFGRGLGASLAGNWDPVLHPRVWRAESRLPENAQGKLTLEALRALFADAEPLADRPEVIEEHRDDDLMERSCLVPRDLACFPGHFPEVPVVPGVLQLDWALELAASLLGEKPLVQEIELLRLRTPLRPGDRFRIRVRIDEPRVDFRIWGDAAEHARGRIRLETRRRDS